MAELLFKIGCTAVAFGFAVSGIALIVAAIIEIWTI